MTIRRACATFVAVVTALVALPTPSTPSAAALNPNLFTLSGQPGEYIIGAKTLSYTDFTVTGGAGGVRVSYPLVISGGVATWWDVDLYPPSGTSLATGFYEDATRYPFQAADVPGLSVSGSGRGCNQLTGRFVIDEITFKPAPDNGVASLVAHWEQHCDGQVPASFGTVSWNGSTPLSPMDAVAPGTFPTVQIDSTSASKPQVITNNGAEPLAVTSATITGRDALQFDITSDPCSGTTIPVGGSCTLQVAFTPTQMGPSFATLIIVDATHPDGATVPLRGAATAKVARFWRQGEEGDYQAGTAYQSYPIDSITGAQNSGSVMLSAGDVNTWMGTAELTPLAVGAYEDAERYSFATAGHPRFDQFGQGRGCNTVSARFVIDQIEWGTNGALSRLAAHWESRCEGGTAGSFGGVNYNATVPFVERSITPAVRDFSGVSLGLSASQTVTVTNVGPSPLHVTSASLAGPNATQFGITSNTCNGATVAKGATCTVVVRYAPTSVGTHTARLVVIDDIAQPVGIGNGYKVALSGVALDAPIAFLEGEDDDGMVGGAHVDLTNVTVSGNRQTIAITGYEGVDQWTVAIAPKKGASFAGGPVLLATQRAGFQDAAHGGLSVVWNDRTCSTATGRLSIEQLTFNANNSVKSLVARWEYHCNGEAASSFGGVRFNSNSGFAVTDLTDEATWEQAEINTLTTPKHVVLTNNGGAPAGIGQVSLSGSDAAQFQVVTDGCSNRQVLAGASCTVSVRFTPSGAVGGKNARLVVPHTGALYGKGGSGQDVLLLGSSTVPAASNFGELSLVSPARLLDTATGVGAPRAPLGAGAFLTVQVTGRGGVPATGVGSVIVNVTTRRSSSSSSFVTVWPAFTSRPAVSTLIPVPGVTVTNLTTVRLGTGGKLHVYNSAGTTDVSIDVVGWYSDVAGPNGARYHSLKPARIIDTGAGRGAPKAPIGAGATLKVDLRGKGGIPGTGVTAVALSVTTVRPTSAGSLTVFAGDRPRPTVPSLSFGAGAAVSNMVVVRLPPTGVVHFFNSAGNTNVNVDVLGYWTSAASGNSGRFVPVTQARVWDTTKLGAPQGPGTTYAWQLGSRNGVAHDAGAAVVNITAVRPSASGFLRVFADDVCTVPTTTTVSFTAGRSAAGGAFSSLSLPRPCAILRSAIDVYNSAGNTHLYIDVAGYFTP